MPGHTLVGFWQLFVIMLKYSSSAKLIESGSQFISQYFGRNV